MLILLQRNSLRLRNKAGTRQMAQAGQNTSMQAQTGQGLLSFKHFSLSFRPRKAVQPAVSDLSLTIRRGEIFALCGESGCGKSVLLRSVLRLLPQHASMQGSISFKRHELTALSEKALRKVRGRQIAAVFQDPFNALSPTKSVGAQIAAQAAYCLGLPRTEAKARALELMDLMELDHAAARFNQLPLELSGGQRQRCALALALAGKPELLLADEITTALDVTVQAHLLKLLRELCSELNLTVVLVSHNLALPARIADRIGVMYAGRLIEVGTAEEIYEHPLHPYTQTLYQALPERAEHGRDLFTLPGRMPPADFPGDPFALRDPEALRIDFVKRPPFFAVTEEHAAASWKLSPEVSGLHYPVKEEL